WDVLLAISGGPTPTLAARDVILSVVLESHFLVPSDPSFFEGARALLDAEQNLYGGTYHTQLYDALHARGLIPLCGDTPEPPASCFLQSQPGTGKIVITDSFRDSSDVLRWTWNKGVATSLSDFGYPVATGTRYAVCVYDGSGSGSPLFDSL